MSQKKNIVPRQYAKIAVGPYKGYFGLAEFDPDDSVFNGRVSGLSDIITFVADDFNQIGEEMAKSIDVYLKFCAKTGHKPDKPKSGKFVVRVKPAVHEAISALSEAQGVSLNAFVEGCLEEAVAGKMPQRPSSLPSAEVLSPAKKREKARLTRSRRR